MESAEIAHPDYGSSDFFHSGGYYAFRSTPPLT